VLVANDRDIVALGAAHHSKPEHPVKGQRAVEISHSNPDVIDPLDCDVLGHRDLRASVVGWARRSSRHDTIAEREQHESNSSSIDQHVALRAQICRCIKSWSRVDRVCMTLRSMEQFEPSVPRQGGVNILIRARRDRQFESPFLQRRVWCESDFRARVPPSGVQFLGEGMAKSELGAKFFPSDGRPQEPKVCRLTAGGRWIRTCMGLFLSSGCLGCADSFLFGAGKAVFRPVACDQVRGARGRGQGIETVAQLGGLPPSVACVWQRLDA
jgi:hypothetical protein